MERRVDLSSHCSNSPCSYLKTDCFYCDINPVQIMILPVISVGLRKGRERIFGTQSCILIVLLKLFLIGFYWVSYSSLLLWKGGLEIE